MKNRLPETLDELTDTYAQAKTRNDAALYGAFNKLRKSVQAQVEFLTTIRDKFTPELAERLDVVIDNGRHALMQVDAVPEEVELGPAALENFQQRMLATNTASAHNLTQTTVFPPPNKVLSKLGMP